MKRWGIFRGGESSVSWRGDRMKNSKIKLLIGLSVILLFEGCGGESQPLPEQTQTPETVQTSEPVRISEQSYKHLFNSDGMKSIEISGEDLINRKEESKNNSLSVKLKNGKTLKLVIRRDSVGVGINLNLYFDDYGCNTLDFLGGNSLDEWAGALKGYYYQMVYCDVDQDGEEEIIVAAGNKKDMLEIAVLKIDHQAEQMYVDNKYDSFFGGGPIAEKSGKYKAVYVDEEHKVNFVDQEGKVSTFDVKVENVSKDIGRFKVEIPQLTEDTEEKKKINALLSEGVKNGLAVLLDNESVNLDGFSPTIKCNNGKILSVLFEGSSHASTAPYPVDFVFTVNIDVQDVKALSTENILVNSKKFYKLIQSDKSGVNFVKGVRMNGAGKPYLYPKDFLQEQTLSDVQSLMKETCYYFTSNKIGIVYFVPHTVGDYFLYEVEDKSLFDEKIVEEVY